MNKRLVVMRHAKSSWKSEASSDHQRPLNKRGKFDAPRMGDRITDLGWKPEVILSSDSRRTRETVDGLAFDQVEVEFWREMYLSGVREVVSFVAQIPQEVQTVMVLGHNPGWEDVVHFLTDQVVVMKTATAALLEIEAVEDWNQAIRSQANWKLVDVLYPREL